VPEHEAAAIATAVALDEATSDPDEADELPEAA